MVKVRISELPTATEFTDDDIMPLVDETGTPGATTKRGNVAQLREHLNDTTDLGDLADVSVGGATNGQTLVRSGSTWIAGTPSGGASALDDLTDVVITSPANDAFLRYDTGTSKWIDEVVTIPTLLDDFTDVNTSGVLDRDFLMFDDATDTWVDHALVLDDATDVNLSGASNGDFLQRQSGVWVDRTLVIDDASDVTISSPSAGQVLTYSGSVWANATPSASALAVTISQTSHGFAVGDVIRTQNNATTYLKAKADSAANAEAVGIVSSVPNANSFVLTTYGYITGLSGLTKGTVYFLSAGTSGLLTATEPTTSGQISKPMLVADGSTSGHMVNYRGIIQA